MRVSLILSHFIASVGSLDPSALIPTQANNGHQQPASPSPGRKQERRKESSYRDHDGKVFSFPPPNASVQQFIDDEVLSSGMPRGAVDTSLPGWFPQLVRIQESTVRPDVDESTTEVSRVGDASNAAATSVRQEDAARRREITPPRNSLAAARPKGPRRILKRRDNPDVEENQELREDNRTLKAQLESAFSHIKGLEATSEIKDREMVEIRLERDMLLQENSRLRDLISKTH